MNEVVSRTILKKGVELQKIVDGPRIMELRTVLDKVVVADPLRDFAVRLVLSTHPTSEFATERIKRYVRWGASPRGARLFETSRDKSADGRGRPAPAPAPRHSLADGC